MPTWSLPSRCWAPACLATPAPGSGSLTCM
uniref:Uncharacterized protein n=1 Tax=Arundo donax TaxID=35708 RepID=A0A0A9AJL0_ARUDO